MLGTLRVDVTAYEEALRLLGSNTIPFDEIDRRVLGFDELDGTRHSLSTRGGDTPLRAVLQPR